MNKLSQEDKTDLLGYGIGVLIAICLLMFVLCVRHAVTAPQPEPYQAPCRAPGHVEIPCNRVEQHENERGLASDKGVQVDTEAGQ